MIVRSAGRRTSFAEAGGLRDERPPFRAGYSSEALGHYRADPLSGPSGHRRSVVAFPRMKALADADDLVGMVAYFESCMKDPKGRAAGRRLEAHGKPSLETREKDFMTLALPHVCGMLIDARQKWLTPRYARHRAGREASASVSVQVLTAGRSRGLPR